jgi:hypothetical protein
VRKKQKVGSPAVCGAVFLTLAVRSGRLKKVVSTTTQQREEVVSISRMTLFTIAGNDDIVVMHAGPDERGKFSGWITHSKERHCRPIVSTDARFDTPEQADAVMRELVKIAKQFTEGDLKDPTNPIVELFNRPEGKIVKEIIEQSQVKAP